MPLYIMLHSNGDVGMRNAKYKNTHKVAIRESVDSLCMDDADMHTHILSFQDSLPSFWSKN